MKKTYIIPAVTIVQVMNSEMVCTVSSVNNAMGNGTQLGKDRVEEGFESEHTGWEDGLW